MKSWAILIYLTYIIFWKCEIMFNIIKIANLFSNSMEEIQYY